MPAIYLAANFKVHVSVVHRNKHRCPSISPQSLEHREAMGNRNNLPFPFRDKIGMSNKAWNSWQI